MKNNEQIDWCEIKRDFEFSGYSYLNAAGMSPLPRSVKEAGNAILEKMHADVSAFADEILPLNIQAHKIVADFYNVNINDIALVNTTSMGMNMVALHLKNIEPQKQEIVTLADEFPSSTIPWSKHNYKIKYILPEQNQQYNIDKILEGVSSNTAAVVASYVQYSTGSRLDVHALAEKLKQHGVHFILNATQAAGVIPIDLSHLPVSAMLTSGNKWIMAGVGGAVLYIPEHVRQESYPPLAGWLSAQPISFNNSPEKLNTGASSLEVGLNSVVPIACVTAAINYINTIGVDKIEQRVLSMTDLLVDGLTEVGAEVLTPAQGHARAGIVLVKRADAVEWVAKLKANGIHVVLRGHDDVRISPHIYNSEEEIIKLIELW